MAGTRLVAGNWVRWAEIYDTLGGKTTTQKQQFTVREMMFTPCAEADSSSSTQPQECQMNVSESVNKTVVTRPKNRDDAVLEHLDRVSGEMDAFGQNDQLMTVSDGLMSTMSDTGGGGTTQQRRLLASSSAYRMRVRRLLLAKMSGNTLKSISKRSATSVLSATKNIVALPAELTTEGAFSAGTLMLASVTSMLSHELRESDYMFTVMRTCHDVAEASMGLPSAKKMADLMLVVVRAVANAGVKYLDVMLESESEFVYKTPNLGLSLQRKQKWSGVSRVKCVVMNGAYDYAVNLSMPIFAIEGSDVVSMSSGKENTVGIMTLWFSEPWLKERDLIITDYVTGIILLRSDSRDLYSSNQRGGSKRRGHSDWDAASMCSVPGQCLDVYMRVNLTEELTANVLVNKSDISCRRWNTTAWSSQYCVVVKATYVPGTSRRDLGHVDVQCACTADGLFAVSRQPRNVGHNHTLAYLSKMERVSRGAVILYACATGAGLAVFFAVLWAVFARVLTPTQTQNYLPADESSDAILSHSLSVPKGELHPESQAYYAHCCMCVPTGALYLTGGSKSVFVWAEAVTQTGKEILLEGASATDTAGKMVSVSF